MFINIVNNALFMMKNNYFSHIKQRDLTLRSLIVSTRAHYVCCCDTN